MASRKNRKSRHQNDHAEIRIHPNADAGFGGETRTARREDGFYASAVTDSDNRTSVFLATQTEAIELTGREARTLQRLLNKHYSELGRSTAVLGAE